MVQGGERKGEREKGRKNNECGKVGKGETKKKERKKDCARGKKEETEKEYLLWKG